MWGINKEIREINLKQTPRFTWKSKKRKSRKGRGSSTIIQRILQ